MKFLQKLGKALMLPGPCRGGKISMSVREVSPVVARLPISLTSPRARILCIAVKLRACTLSEISQVLNETLPASQLQ